MLTSALVLFAMIGQEATLPPNAVRVLAAAEVRAVAPTWLPEGFAYRECRLQLGLDPLETSATLEFWGEAGSFFTVDMASDGLGDLPLEGPDGKPVEKPKTVAVGTGLLGPISFEHATVGEWSGFQTTWERVGGAGFPQYARISGQGLSADQAKKVIQGLTRLGEGQ